MFVPTFGLSGVLIFMSTLVAGGDDDDDGPMAKLAKTESPGVSQTPPGAAGVMAGMAPGVRPAYAIPG
jgi:hypothetical protein